MRAPHTASALLDTDRNAATGCSVATPAGTASGIEWRITAVVEGAPPMVVAVEHARCLSGIFAAPAVHAVNYPVGLNNGLDGADVVELAVELASLSGLGSNANLHFLAESATGADLVSGTGLALPGSGLMTPQQIPSLGWLGLAAILFIVLILARRHPALRGLGVVMLLTGAGVVWVAGFIADGQVGDWATESPLALVSPNSSSSGETAIEITAVYAPDPAFSGNDSFSYVANNGQSDSAEALVAITVGDVNAAPSFTAVNPPAVLEDAGAQSVADWASFSPGPAHESDQAVLGYFVSNISNPALFAVAPAADANGSSTFDVHVQDDGGTANGGVDVSPTQTFTITVNAVNDAPSFTAGANQSVLEGSGAHTIASWATDISAGPPDESGQVLAFAVTANSNPGLLSAGPTVDAISGDLSFSLAADAFGVAEVPLVLGDDGGTDDGGSDSSAPHLLTITVTPVNDAPTFTAVDPPAVLQDSGAQIVANWASFSPGPANESDQPVLGYFVSNVSNPALFAVAPTVANDGTLSYTPATGASGTSTFDMHEQDDGGTANGGVDVSPTQTLTITVEQSAVGKILLTSSNGSVGFYGDDIADNNWTMLASPPVTTRSQITNDGESVYLMGQDNVIYVYDIAANTWTASIAGPGAATGNPIGFFQRFDGGFYYLKDGSSTMHVHRSGTWTSFAIGSARSSAGSWDQANNELYIRTWFQLGFQVIDTTSDTITRTIVDTEGVGENSRTGSYANGNFYARTFDGSIQRLDAQTGALQDTGATPLSDHTGSDTDHRTGLLYISGYGGEATSLQVFNPADNTISTLSDQPSVSNHATMTVMR